MAWPGVLGKSMTETVVTSTLDLNTRLEQLEDDYTYRVNMLLEEGRDDLAAVLADEFVDAAARLLRG
jgi:hypothetical protein